MADKHLGKKTFESLARASLSVRYTRLINEQPSSGAAPTSVPSRLSETASTSIAPSKPRLRTVVEACPPASMKGLLGVYQGNIRMFQSPFWLLEEQRRLPGKHGHDPAGEKRIAAGNSLLDLCRFVEILLNKIGQEKYSPTAAETANKLGEKLAAIWSDLYLALQHMRDDCKRSGALVRHAGMELLDLGVELEDGHSYPDVWAQKLVSRLEMLSAGIADAYELLHKIPKNIKEKNKSIKNVLSPNASTAKKSEAEKRLVTFNHANDANAGIPHEIAVICNAVNELVIKLGESDTDSSETIGMLKLCAARLKSMLSSSYSLKRWELELHRAHYIFRQAARQLATDQEKGGQDTVNVAKKLPYGRMADYIGDRFEDTVEHILQGVDTGYARHNFTIRKQSVRTNSRGVLRSLVTSPVRKNVVASNTFHKPDLIPAQGQRAAHLQNQTAGKSTPASAVTSPPASTAANTALPKSAINFENEIGESKNTRAEVKEELGVARQRRPTQDVNVRRSSDSRAATMTVYWQEIQSLSDQQRSGKKPV
jgi:hypothetical protein